MNRIAIITDTSSNLDFNICKKYGINMIPYNINIENNTFKDLVTISSKELFDAIVEKDVLTSIPSPNDIQEFIENLHNEGFNKMLFFTTSSEITGMCNLITLVSKEFNNIDIKVLDTKNTGIPVGLISIYAKNLVDNDIEFNIIYDDCKNLLQNMNVYALFRTLKYVVKGGRLPKWKGSIGDFLKIQPIATIQNGEVYIKEKLRGIQASRKRLVEIIKEDLKNAKRYYFGVFNGINEDELAYLKEELKDIIQNSEIFVESILGAALGVHGGPETVGCGYLIIE